MDATRRRHRRVRRAATYPASDTNYVGLLPDSFNLRAQTRNAANINPATLLAPAVKLFHESAIYDFHCFRQPGLQVHAPGELSDLVEQKDGVSFTVTTWSPRPSYVVVNGLSKAPSARLDGRAVQFNAPHEYQSAEGRLILQIQQRTRRDPRRTVILRTRGEEADQRLADGKICHSS